MKEENYYSNKGAIMAPLRTHVRGIEAGSHSTQPFVATQCGGITKEGVACPAKPVKGQPLCVGHLRQAKAQFPEDVFE